MRSLLWGMAVVGPVFGAALLAGPGCGSLPDDCKERFVCGTGTTGTGGATSSSTTSSGGNGGGGGTPAGCVPSENAAAVDDACGVFVSSSLGKDGAAGSKSAPLKSLTEAAAKAAMAKLPVYACGEKFTEAVSIDAGVEVFGGLDCKSGWKWVGLAKMLPTTLTAAADMVPLSIAGDSVTAKIHDFSVEAASAKKDGGSSIAVIVDLATAAFHQTKISAGDGAPGVAGTTPTDNVGPMVSSDPTIIGQNGQDACSTVNMAFGGAAVDNPICPIASGGPIGGAGGMAAVANGSAGDASAANPQTALGGKGELNVDPTWSCVVGAGAIGNDGAPGTDGDGAAGAMALGTIDATGYTGLPGKDGASGKPGQGGGGGGGAKGRTSCAGATGGSGGTGGCGGGGGKGGTAGGASIGIVAVGATLSFDVVTIAAGNGGNGGDGAPGQIGGVGGFGGKGGQGSSSQPPTKNACGGGDGGHGGLGGMGGGGRGGHVLGVAVSGASMPDTKGVTFSLAGKPGSGGGAGAPMKGGDLGVKQNVQVFP